MKFNFASWRTTVLGIIAGLPVCLTQVKHLLDDDPATTFSIEQFMAGVGAMGLGLAARDNKVTSEQVNRPAAG